MTGAIGYARVSTDEQARENNSLAVQRRKISSHCEANNLSLLKTFEESESARTMDRPGLQELLNYCRTNRRKISHVVVSDLSRLARNVQDQAQIIVTLKKLDITMVSIDEPLTDDSAMGQFVPQHALAASISCSATRSPSVRDIECRRQSRRAASYGQHPLAT